METFDSYNVSLLVEDYLKRESLINTHNAFLNESPWLRLKDHNNTSKRLSINLKDLLLDYARRKDDEMKYNILFNTMEDVCHMLERTRYKLHRFKSSNSARRLKDRHKRCKHYMSNDNSDSDSSDHQDMVNAHFTEPTHMSVKPLPLKIPSLNCVLPYFTNVTLSSNSTTQSTLNSYLKHQLEIINSPNSIIPEKAKISTCDLTTAQCHSSLVENTTSYIIPQATKIVPLPISNSSINVDSIISLNTGLSNTTNNSINSLFQNLEKTPNETLTTNTHCHLSPSKKKFSEQETIQNLIALLGISPERRIKWPNLIQNLIEDTKFQKALADVINNNLHTSPNFKDLNVSDNMNSSVSTSVDNLICSKPIVSSNFNVMNSASITVNKRKRKKTTSNEYVNSLNSNKNHSENIDESLNKSLPLNNDILTDILEMIEIGPEFEPLFNILTDKKDCVNDDVAHLTPFLTFDVDEIYENSSFWNQTNQADTKSQDANEHCCHDNASLLTPDSKRKTPNQVSTEAVPEVLLPSHSSVNRPKPTDNINKIFNAEDDNRPFTSLPKDIDSAPSQQTGSIDLATLETTNNKKLLDVTPATTIASIEESSLSTTLNPTYLQSLGLTPLTFPQHQQEAPHTIDLEDNDEKQPSDNPVPPSVIATSIITEDQLNAMIRAKLKGMRQILPKQQEDNSTRSVSRNKRTRSKKKKSSIDITTTKTRALYDSPEKEVAQVLASLSSRDERRDALTTSESSTFRSLQSVAAQSLLTLSHPDNLTESEPSLTPPNTSVSVSNGHRHSNKRLGKSAKERSPIVTRKGRAVRDRRSTVSEASTTIVKSDFLNTLYTKLTDQGLKVKKISTSDGNNTTLMVDPKSSSPALLPSGNNEEVKPHNFGQVENASTNNLKQHANTIHEHVKVEENPNETNIQCPLVLPSKSDFGCRHKKQYKFKSAGGEQDVQTFLAKVFHEKIANNPKIN